MSCFTIAVLLGALTYVLPVIRSAAWDAFLDWYTVRNWRPGTPLDASGLRAGPRFSGHSPLAAQDAAAPGAAHVWPSARGQFRSLSRAPHAGPRDLNANYWWSFHHPAGFFSTVCLGVVLDEHSNVYLSCDDAIRKFSPDGRLLWRYVPSGSIPDPRPEHMAGWTNIGSIPSLMDGALFGSTFLGYVFAVDIATGKERWSVFVGNSPEDNKTGDDNNFVGSHDGIVVTMRNRCTRNPPCSPFGGSYNLVALNATSGSELWDFKPDGPFWNFFALFLDDGTFAFQDLEGRGYRLNLHTGKMLWKAGGVPGTWTDGTAMLGDGVLYTVSVDGGPLSPGKLWAFRISDGRELWMVPVPQPPNSWPLPLPGTGTVLIPIGQQGGPFRGDLVAFDEKTGAQRWYRKGPTNSFWGGGDVAGGSFRNARKLRPGCGPNPWSAPTVDALGAVFVGFQDGYIYRLHDANGDGALDPLDPAESSRFFTGAHASVAAGSAFGPGIMAHVSCDGLFVFKA